MQRRCFKKLGAQLSAIDSQLSQIPSLISLDFFDSTSSPWSSGALVSGTLAGFTSGIRHYGAQRFTSSTSANSGYRYFLPFGSVRIYGGEITTIIFMLPTSISATSIFRFGFMDAVDHVASGNQASIQIAAGVLTGLTSKVSTHSVTASSFTLAPVTWYERLSIKSTVFRLYPHVRLIKRR